MLDILCYGFLAAFGIGAAMFTGCGNYNGVRGAIIPGIITGLVLCIPFQRDEWSLLPAVILVATGVVGSVIVALLSDENRFKRFCREYPNLRIKVGSYRLGGKSD